MEEDTLWPWVSQRDVSWGCSSWQSPCPADVHLAAEMKADTLCWRNGVKLRLVPLKRSVLLLPKLLCQQSDPRAMEKSAVAVSGRGEAAHGHSALTLCCLPLDVELLWTFCSSVLSSSSSFVEPMEWERKPWIPESHEDPALGSFPGHAREDTGSAVLLVRQKLLRAHSKLTIL